MEDDDCEIQPRQPGNKRIRPHRPSLARKEARKEVTSTPSDVRGEQNSAFVPPLPPSSPQPPEQSFLQDLPRRQSSNEEEAPAREQIVFDDSALRQFIMGREDAITSRLLKQLTGIHTSLADLQSGMCDMKNMYALLNSQVHTLVLSGDSEVNRTATPSKSRVDVNSRCDAKLPHFNLVFNEDVILKVALVTVVHILSREAPHCKFHPSCPPGDSSSGTSSISPANTTHAMNTVCSASCIGHAVSATFRGMLFGKKAHMHKSVLQSGAGKAYSRLRRMLVFSLIRNVQGNYFGQFEDHHPVQPSPPARCGASNGIAPRTMTAGRDVAVASKTARIPRMAWIMPNSITATHVDTIRRRMETKADKVKKGKGNKLNNNSEPTDDDVALRCTHRLYTKITGYMHDGRERARSHFFECLGYALGDWNTFVVSNEIDRPKVRWAHADATNSVTSILNVPETAQRGVHEGTVIDNMPLVSPFLKNCRDMNVTVEHGVRISHENGTGAASSAEDQSEQCHSVRKLRRIVNLVEVALRFLTAFCGGSLHSTLNDIISSNSEMLRAAYAIAIVFQQMVDQFIRKVGVSDGFDNCEEPEVLPRSISFDGVSLDDLLPTPTNQQKVYHKMVLGISEHDFAQHNVPARDITSRQNTFGASGDNLDELADFTDKEDAIEGCDYVLCRPT